MRKIFFTSFLMLVFQGGIAQTINFELTSATPQFQDADVGDMEFFDADNDGDNDLIIIGKGGPVLTTLYINDGNGNFSEADDMVFEDVFGGKIGVNDIDNDGDLDLLIAGSNSFPILSTNLYVNNGTGNFNLVPNTPFEAFQSGDLAFGDVDNDGDDDVLLTGLNDADIRFSKLYLNNGFGVFSEMISTSFEPLWESVVELFDYDNDGDLDVILAGGDVNNNAFTGLYANNGLGEFSLVTNASFNDFLGGDIAIGDSDNDGDLDVLICGNKAFDDIKTELYLNDGTGDFSLLQNTTFSDVSLGEASFQDFDSDGDLDVFLIGTGDGGLATNSIVGNVFENQGANNYIFADSLIGGYLSSHAVADIDGDDDLDLVLGGTTIGSPTRATWMYTNVTPISVGIEETNASTPIVLYPNPSNGTLNVRLKEKLNASIEIYSSIGRIVYTDYLKYDNNQIELNLPSGMYYMVIKNKEEIFTNKLILNK